MACYEDLRALYAATAKERDELRKENEQLREICQKQAELNGKIAAMALELDTVTAQRDTLLRIVNRAADCNLCAHNRTELPCADDGCMLCGECEAVKVTCCHCRDGSHFQWSGTDGTEAET